MYPYHGMILVSWLELPHNQTIDKRYHGKAGYFCSEVELNMAFPSSLLSCLVFLLSVGRVGFTRRESVPGRVCNVRLWTLNFPIVMMKSGCLLSLAFSTPFPLYSLVIHPVRLEA